jgi:hypothetical protein
MEEYIVRVYDNRTEWRNKDGKHHRIGGPAEIRSNGHKEWWFNGQQHREDGPAVIFKDGTKAWYIKGIQYTEAEYHKAMAPVKELTMPELEKLLGHKVKIKAETT